jgi:dTDP-glucose pyrophosphorylase
MTNIKIQSLIAKPDITLSEALRRMDNIDRKLLIIADASYTFLGLLSIGDIQRAIIADAAIDAPALKFIRANIRIASDQDDNVEVKKQILQFRLEYMPILDQNKKVIDVIFWEDVVSPNTESDSPQLNLPVVIMAGGFGTRLRPLTNILPKPLLPYGDSTILENIIGRFQKFGCNHFHVSVNYKADLIQFYFDSLGEKEYNVSLFTEDKPLGTAGSLGLLQNKLSTPFFVSNCDILIDQDYSAIYDYHKEHNNELTLVASLKQYNIPYGTLESGANGELISLKEKPELTFMINCGMYLLEPHLLKEIPEDTFFHITHLIEQIKNRGGKVGVFPVSEKSWVDIGEWPLYSKVLFQ